MPKAYKQLREITTRLEKHYKDVQDFEFTIQDERLFMLQTRSGKRTGYAAVVIATDLVAEKLITPKEAVLLVDPESLNQLLAPGFDPDEWKKIPAATKGLPASPGAASGQVVFSADDAVEWTEQGKQVILVRRETVPDDIHGMFVVAGHPDRDRRHDVARGGRRPPDGQAVDRRRRRARDRRDGEAVPRRRPDGQGGRLHLVRRPDGRGEARAGRVEAERDPAGASTARCKPKKSDIYQRFEQLLSWADKFRRMGVRANADLPDQAELAYAFGARGIGLCRTEHMFFGEGRIPIVQRMILADNEADRRKALDELLPLQRDDFYGVFKAMHGHAGDDPDDRSAAARVPAEARGSDGRDRPARSDRQERGTELDEKRRLLHRVEQLHEFNPMLGHRGVRLGITYPEITEMQTRAIIEAACRLHKEGLKVVPEIMIPLVGHVKELRDQKAIVDRVAAETMKAQGVKIKYLVGTMIEVPRGAMTADQIAAGGAVLLVRHQRPDAADLRLLARRHRQVPADLSGQEDSREGSVRVDRHRGRRRARADRRRARPQDAARI